MLLQGMYLRVSYECENRKQLFL